MNTNVRSITARLVLISGIAASAATLVPAAASAGCVGEVFEAKANNEVIQGTGCNDIINLRRYVNVTVHAGGGDDIVSAGFVGNNGINYIFLEGGNDTVTNSSDKRVWVSGGAGNDTVTGSSGVDAFYGGSGTDTFIEAPTASDYFESVEKFI